MLRPLSPTSPRTVCRAALAAACTGLLLTGAVPAQPGQAKDKARPAPDVADARYGPHERNVLDLWKANTNAPAPLVVFIHGGGFRAGDKSDLHPGLLALCREAGLAVAAINYRLSQHAPFPAPMLDSARALQFLRAKAADWHLDSKRVAATGGSAGAGISLWLGFRDDLADPASADAVARQSTRLTCMAVGGAQSSYDPRWIKQVVGGRAHEHPALPAFYGLKADELDTPRAHKLYDEAAPINYVTRDDPPVFLYYTESKDPLPPDAGPGQGIHHPRFGVALKEKLDPLKIECILRHRDDYLGERNPMDGLHREMVAFFKKHFGMAREEGGAKDRP